MPTPTTSIDALPAKTAPAGTELLVLQDAGVTKKMAVSELYVAASPQLTAHINNATDAHDATAVSATDSGSGVNGATVQAQLGQLATAVNTNATAINARVLKVGDVMTGPLQAQRFVGTDPAPTAANHMTRKDYVDGTFVANAGGTMTGVLNVDGNIGVTDPAGLMKLMVGGTQKLLISAATLSSTVPFQLPADPVQPLEATTKSYVDTAVAALAGRVLDLEARLT